MHKNPKYDIVLSFKGCRNTQDIAQLWDVPDNPDLNS